MKITLMEEERFHQYSCPVKNGANVWKFPIIYEHILSGAALCGCF